MMLFQKYYRERPFDYGLLREKRRPPLRVLVESLGKGIFEMTSYQINHQSHL
jgi:hypothetical protein